METHVTWSSWDGSRGVPGQRVFTTSPPKIAATGAMCQASMYSCCRYCTNIPPERAPIYTRLRSYGSMELKSEDYVSSKVRRKCESSFPNVSLGMKVDFKSWG
ncbi:hypothetical protein J6590_104801 [Homalodisca vitripennis]|nr:hypothetical protein J6590_002481 [Homalodisca vitripennis]KAG8323903.1 hypothetical protein J6590_104801 [Homalodisca vitripennis]